MADRLDGKGVLQAVRVPEWPRPSGYENGMITAGEGERILFVAGQVGWEPDMTFRHQDLAGQFARALDNVLAVVRAAGGTPQSVARMTVYVTDVEAYRGSVREIGKAWRERFGRHYPAMALIGIAALVEVGAKVEIEATCVLRAGSSAP